MKEKIVCSDFDDTMTSKIKIDAFILKKLEHVNAFLRLVAEHDESLVEKLLEKYKEKLVAKNIATKSDEILQQYEIDYSKYTTLLEFPDYLPLLENAVLHFLDFQKYTSKYQHGEELEVHYANRIRGDFYALYFLAYVLQELLPRENVLELAKECTNQLNSMYQDQISKYETLEEMFSSYHGDGCWKTHNIVAQIKDGRYYLKVTRCIWADVYSELPDLELASLLECYGDFSVMQFTNPNLVLSRTKTRVEGHSYCDFVYYDKRIETEIEHPDENYWKEFK